ncbi:MAG: hypothetical protein HYR85_00385 [Planctomycetes bacterium]|nr:hypothetical protein [Planctomycetota bacterium]
MRSVLGAPDHLDPTLRVPLSSLIRRRVARSFAVVMTIIGASGSVAMAQGTIDAPKPETIATLDALSKKCGFTIKRPDAPFSRDGGTISGDPPIASEIDAAAPILDSELGKYPREFWRRCSLTFVVLSRNLHGAKKRMAGAFAEDGRLYVDVAFAKPRRGADDDDFRITLHHEIFHAIDSADEANDAEWSKLNPTGFTYAPLSDPPKGGLKCPHGFVTAYATTSVREDRAETFARLIVCHVGMESRATDDPILRSKIALLKRFVGEHHPKMGEEFWSAVLVTVSRV